MQANSTELSNAEIQKKELRAPSLEAATSVLPHLQLGNVDI